MQRSWSLRSFVSFGWFPLKVQSEGSRETGRAERAHWEEAEDCSSLRAWTAMFSNPSVIWGPIKSIKERVPAQQAPPTSLSHGAAYQLGTPKCPGTLLPPPPLSWHRKITSIHRVDSPRHHEAAPQNNLSMMKAVYSGGWDPLDALLSISHCLHLFKCPH